MIVNPASTNIYTTTNTLKNDKEAESREPADGFQKSEEKMGYFENLGKSTLYGFRKGASKGIEKGFDITDNMFPNNSHNSNQLFSIIPAMLIGLPIGFLFSCVSGPAGAISGFAMGIIGKNIGKP